MKLKFFSSARHLLLVCIDAIALGVALTLCLSACSRGVMTPQEASRWIAAYAPERIDCNSPIRLELTDLAISQIDSARSLDGAFTFSPRVKGKARLSDDRRFIDFVPTGSLKQGQRYECRVNMHDITGVDSLPDFAFDFYVDKREMVFEEVTATVDPDDIAFMTIRGVLSYNVAAGDSVTADSSIIQCDYPGAHVVMAKKTQGRSRGFKISGIKRHNKGTKLMLRVNPKGGFNAEEQEIDIPSLADFKLLNAERVDAPAPYINLNFSAPLSAQQELDGLITIDNINDIKIERNGANVKLYYPVNGLADLTVRISDLLKNADGRSLDTEIERHFAQELIPPAVELPFEGYILPDDKNLRLPFKAVNLAAVDVEVVKIYPHNVMPFLQGSDMYSSGEMRRFGRPVYRHTIRLDGDKSLNLHQWQDFAIDLSNLFERERGAIYNIWIAFRKAYSLYNRSEPEEFEEVTGISEKVVEVWNEPWSSIYRDAPDSDWRKYDWNERNDPTKLSYYMDNDSKMPSLYLVATNLGIIAKSSPDGIVKTVVTDILTALPKGGISVTAYNYQLRPMGHATTDKNGFADIRTSSRPYLVTASDGHSTTYLKLKEDLSTSNFDVSGMKVTKGIKGFTYGDRGVWRPGDDIHLTLIVEDKDKTLPSNHPVVLELYNPSEQLYSRQVLDKGVDGFYTFHIATDEYVPTGLWSAKFTLGNETFKHPVRIETIKPNRLKISIDAPEVIQASTLTPVGISARWLTGPLAKSMKAKVELDLIPNPAPFKNYKDYTFTNPLVEYSSSQRELFAGTTDSLGRISRKCSVNADINSPGMLMANITARVTEPGGDASIAGRTVAFSPFGVYVGLNLKRSEFETDTDIKLPVAVVNQVGARMKTRQLDYKIYRLDWNWWWEGGADYLSRYVRSSTAEVVSTGTVTATDGFAEVPFRVEYPEWGRYLVLVRDTKGGHATGGFVTVDWPEWRGRSNKGSASGSTELVFTLDKDRYEVGEKAHVYLPKCDGGRVLLSIENGSRVLKRLWVDLSGETETKYPIPVERSMAPNFYVSATLLRPHKSTDFDTPIRLFGVQGAKVVDPRSILHPVIEMDDELHPRQPFVVTIKEKDNKPMTYTLAIVDEGLLDITNFKTPRPWPAMNQKVALGVCTWDIFDDVIGAFGSGFRSIARVGGDEALRKAAGKEKRFNPVVRFMGPYTLQAGAKSHKITLPNYVGSVRVMVVAAHDGSYGNADKTVKVTSPLMVLTTLPRSLANCDTVEMPVNVFAMDKGRQAVAVAVETDGPVKVAGSASKNLSFSGVGEQVTSFRLICDNATEGKARIIVKVSSTGYTATDTTFINVCNPMPEMYESQSTTLKPKGSAMFDWTQDEADEVSLQVASMPMLNFNGVAKFMEHYPHHCTEQLSSKALFMLYGRKFLEADSKARCEKQLPYLIKAIHARQLANGGFVYWPGRTEDNEWVSSMAGLALAEACRQGFRVDRDGLDRWKEYQSVKARDYKYSLSTDLVQAFRLYSLVVAGKSPAAAMNRLRESKRLSREAAYCLAAAYAETGRKDVARKMIERVGRTEWECLGGMFRSELSDKALALNALALCGMVPEALPVAREIASECSASNYVTHDIALATVAMNHLSSLMGEGECGVKIVQSSQSPIVVEGITGLKDMTLSHKSGRVEVENISGKGSVEVSLLRNWHPKATAILPSFANGLKMTVRYTDMAGKPMVISRLKQDDEFMACVTVTNFSNDVDNMALSIGLPSGWEIWNERLHGAGKDSYDNCDIRDASARFYFGLGKGESRTVRLRIRAAYSGHFVLPPVVCEDMYNPACRAMISNRRVSVVQ